jgi:hypothetical protein
MDKFPREAWIPMHEKPLKVRVISIQYVYGDDDRYRPCPPTQYIANVFLDEGSCRAAIVNELQGRITKAESVIRELEADNGHT